MKNFLKADLRDAERRGDLAEVYELLRAIQDIEAKRVVSQPPNDWARPSAQARVKAFKAIEP